MKTFNEIKKEFVESAKAKGVKTLNPVVVAWVGLIGSGKSTLARELSRMLGWHLLSVEKIRVLLREKGKGFTVQNTNEIVSAIMHKILRAGGNVVLDSDFVDTQKRKRAEKFARKFNAKVFYIRTFCNNDVVIDRLIHGRYNKKTDLFLNPVVALREHLRRTPWHYNWSKLDGGRFTLKKFGINFLAEIDTTKPSVWKKKLKLTIEKLKKL